MARGLGGVAAGIEGGLQWQQERRDTVAPGLGVRMCSVRRRGAYIWEMRPRRQLVCHLELRGQLGAKSRE